MGSSPLAVFAMVWFSIVVYFKTRIHTPTRYIEAPEIRDILLDMVMVITNIKLGK